MDYRAEYERWKKYVTEEERAELERIAGNEEEIRERFGSEIAFGTAGLRGIYGMGTSRMNPYTVGRATQGIADFILASGEDKDRGFVLAFDVRYHSEEFARQAAQILTANGIPAYIFPEMRSTPELSFTIRHLHALGGINLTASHNPKEYNGYKVYWTDGAQISGEVADGMSGKIEALDFFREMPSAGAAGAPENAKITVLGTDIDEAYFKYILSLSQRDKEELDLSVKAVYTPLHGAGNMPVRRVFSDYGFPHVDYVPEQCVPDPEFTTVGNANPEDPKTFALSEKLGDETGADILIATDPDADRMAIEVRGEDGKWQFLNGNQTGALLISYMAKAQTEKGTLGHAAMIKSIVTGNLGAKICRKYGIDVFEALTGFKNICGRIPELQEQGYRIFFAYEESIGCAPDAGVRDKDGIAAAMLVLEMACHLRKQGKTVYGALQELYREFGYFAEEQVSLVLTGNEGKMRIGRIVRAFREDTFGKTGDAETTGSSGIFPENAKEKTDYINGHEDIPAADVLKYVMKDGSWFALRPSGTEPKLKFYFYTSAETKEEAERALRALRDCVIALAESIS